MNYSKVYIDAIGYQLAPVVVTSEELEARLAPTLAALRIPAGQLRAWTGIVERRWWPPGFELSCGAVAAARHALDETGIEVEAVEALIYAGVCRENFEPATACRVAAELGVPPKAAVLDISNACLGVLNGIIDIANRIELGQIRAGMVVSCESAREINETMIGRMLDWRDLELFKGSLATLTGGSGAVAVLVTDGTFPGGARHRLAGGVHRTAPRFHDLCRWGLEHGTAAALVPFMRTDSVAVLKHGVELGVQTWQALLESLTWSRDRVDRVICHQVGSAHRDAVLPALGIPAEKDFSTFAHLGNIGTVSLPLTAALADEREVLRRGDHVAFLGIGSGLNCLMLGLEW